MNFIASILAVIIFILSLHPCSDGSKSICGKDINIAGNHHDSNKSQHNDFCTPFCTCTCCAASITLAEINFQLASIFSFPNKNCGVYQDSDVITFSYSIWLPPKI